MIPPFTLRNAEEVKGAIFISAIAGVILWAAAWTICYELRVRKWLRTYDEHHLSAKAKVTSVVPLNDNGSINFHYSFTDVSGKEFRGSQVFPNLIVSSRHITFAQGDTITVVYHPDDPRLSYIEGYLDYYQRRETGYIQGFISMIVFISSFYYTSSLVWPFMLTLAFSLLMAAIRLAIRSSKR